MGAPEDARALRVLRGTHCLRIIDVQQACKLHIPCILLARACVRTLCASCVLHTRTCTRMRTQVLPAHALRAPCEQELRTLTRVQLSRRNTYARSCTLRSEQLRVPSCASWWNGAVSTVALFRDTQLSSNSYATLLPDRKCARESAMRASIRAFHLGAYQGIRVFRVKTPMCWLDVFRGCILPITCTPNLLLQTLYTSP